VQPSEQPVERLSLSLDACLDMRAAAALKSELLQGLAMAKPLLIDAGAVSRMSTACVQVLTAFIFAARKAGTPLTIKNPSSVFETAFANLGLGDVLGSTKPQATS
jgi:anti-anti-sigma regulatory factor